MKEVYGSDFLRVRNSIWISALNRNGLFQYNIKNKKVLFKGVFPEENMWGSSLHCCILKWEESLIFIPDMARHISFYHLKSGVFDTCRLPQYLEGVDHKFGNAVIWNNKLFLFGDQILNILVMDLLSREYKSLNNLNIEANLKYNFMPYISKDYVIVDNEIFLITRHSGVIYKINMDTEQIAELCINETDSGHALICNDGENFWSLENFKIELRCWNEKDGIIEKKILPRHLFDTGGFWTESVYFDKEVLLFQTQGIVFFNPKTQKIVALKGNDLYKTSDEVIKDSGVLYKKNAQKILTKHEIENSLYLLTDIGNMYKLTQNHSIENIYPLISEDWFMEEKMRWLNEIKKQHIILEQDTNSIKIFMACINSMHDDVNQKKNGSGKRINQEIVEVSSNIQT